MFTRSTIITAIPSLCILLPMCGVGLAQNRDVAPNVLFIAVDDLNDWVGCLAGHPQAKTPNIDRLAAKGVLFEQAYCAAPLCHPSRTAILTGLCPSTTGVYGNRNWFRNLPRLKDWTTLPQHFRKNGYLAVSGGKIFHKSDGEWSDPQSWDEQYSTAMGTPPPPESERYRHGMRGEFSNKILDRLIDWAPLETPKEETQDLKTAQGAASFLKRSHDKPFFLACGIYRPHLSWYAPKEFFDLHPLDKIELPPYLETDLEDVPARGRVMAGKEFEIIRDHDQWKQAVQGYLASTSFADSCVGVVLDALNESRYRNNTIVVLWGDHGYHLGQKNHVAKSALWQPATRTPLIIHVPGQSESQPNRDSEERVAALRCKRPVSLIDLYPTLIELCGLPPRDDLDGRSVAPLVRDPTMAWPYPAIITHSPHWHGVNHAIRSQRYHYIRYGDGGEELYDMTKDPNQWKNLADSLAHTDVIKEHRKWLPAKNAVHHTESATRVHRLKSTFRSPFDAFLYVNRIPASPESDETQDDLAGRILGRLANQEGRVLIKLPPGMNRDAYHGFKIALGSESRRDSRPETRDKIRGKANTCIACHHLPDPGHATAQSSAPSLRNRAYPKARFQQLIQNETHKHIPIDNNDVDLLHAFVQSLSDVSDAEFRELIIDASVVDTSVGSQ